MPLRITLRIYGDAETWKAIVATYWAQAARRKAT